jgi:hypothetical protein
LYMASKHQMSTSVIKLFMASRYQMYIYFILFFYDF